MDAALKQRLIGATVLVALAVIFLPMLVDGPEAEREAESARLSLDLPTPPDRPMETREIPLLRPSASAEGTNPAPAGEPPLPVVDTQAPERIDALSPTGGVPGSEAGEVTQTEVPPVAASESSTPAPAPPAQASTPSAEPPARPASAPERPSPTSAAAAPVVASSSSAPAPAPAPRSGVPEANAAGRYAVNVGSYANVANAENLVVRLRNAGLPVYAESVTLQGRPVRRVRLGPFALRGEAERARQSALAVQRDLPTSVISLEAQAQAPALARQPTTEGYAVQLGALRSAADANALRDRVRSAGFVAFVEQVNADVGTLWRVRVGPELDRASAERRRTEIKAKLNLDGRVVTHP